MNKEKSNLYTPKIILSASSIIKLSLRMMANINRTIATHNERTAYLALRLVQHHQMNSKCTNKNLLLLSLFHTIGFFKYDPLFNPNPFENEVNLFSTAKETESKYVYGYYYLENMTPLKDSAIVLKFFNKDYQPELINFFPQAEYKSIIYLCARVNDYITNNPDKELPEDLNSLFPEKLDPLYVQVFNKANKDNKLIKKLNSGKYSEELLNIVDRIQYNEEDTKQLLKFVVYMLDFKSTSTFAHTINTSCYACSLAMRLGLSEEEIDILFASALLHDIGKIAIPHVILEFPGKLSAEEMGIMRRHVNHTKKVLQGIVDDEICENAFRHHEKLNGSGYPQQLTADEITLTQRILTVADITSALSDTRSYKGEFSKETMINIMNEMTQKGELDSSITHILETDFEEIHTEVIQQREDLRVDYNNVFNKFYSYYITDTSDFATEEAELEEL